MPADLFILFPLLAVVALNLPFQFLGAGIATTVVLLFALFQSVVSFFPCCEVLPSSFFQWTVGEHNYWFLGTIALVVLVTAITAQHRIADKQNRFYFMNLLLIAMAGMNGLTMVSDLFTIYLFLEVVAISSWVFIAMDRKHQELEGAIKYFMMSALATMMWLSGLAIIFLLVGDTSFVTVREFAVNNLTHPLFLLATVLLTIALCIKGGVVPFHHWAPDAYGSAPTHVSILLAGITTKITGVYTLMRIYHEMIPSMATLNELLLILGSLSIVVGALAAFRQNEMKRILAYSSISQVGYIILAMGCGTELGYIAAVFHFINHALSKAQLFTNIAAVEEQIGTTRIMQWSGVAEKMPLTGWSTVFGFLTTAGIPPFFGFWTKLLVVIAVWQSGHNYFAAFAIAVSILTINYFLRLLRLVFYGKWNESLPLEVTEASWALVTPAILMIIVSFLMIIPLLNKTMLVFGGLQ